MSVSQAAINITTHDNNDKEVYLGVYIDKQHDNIRVVVTPKGVNVDQWIDTDYKIWREIIDVVRKMGLD